jgi:hypothetical protein
MKKLTVLLIVLVCGLSSMAQQQPFEKYGYKVKIATLSKGKYVEHFDQDTIVQIGTVMFNRRSGKIVSFVEYDTTFGEYSLQPELVSRWMSQDPLADEFYDQSPYSFALNNPINYIDPDGMEAISNIESNYIAICPDCPNTPQYKPYIDDPNNVYHYDPTSGNVSILLNEVTVTADKPSTSTASTAVPIFYLPEYSSPAVTVGAGAMTMLAMTVALVFTPVAGAGEGEAEILAKMRRTQMQMKSRNPAQDKKLSPGEIDKLKRNGWDHSDKGKSGGKTDLYKDEFGNIYQKPKGGTGEGEPIGVNLNDLN